MTKQKPKLQRVKCTHVSREVEQTRTVTEQGVRWHCPKCNAELIIWNDGIVVDVDRGKVVTAKCDKCGTVHEVDDKRIVTVGGSLVTHALQVVK